jgi:hypothetical protein
MSINIVVMTHARFYELWRRLFDLCFSWMPLHTGRCRCAWVSAAPSSNGRARAVAKDGRNRSSNRFEGLPQLRVLDSRSCSSPSLTHSYSLAHSLSLSHPVNFSLAVSLHLTHAQPAPTLLYAAFKLLEIHLSAAAAVWQHLNVSIYYYRSASLGCRIRHHLSPYAPRVVLHIKSNHIKYYPAPRTLRQTITPPVGARRVIIIITITILTAVFFLNFFYHCSDTLNTSVTTTRAAFIGTPRQHQESRIPLSSPRPNVFLCRRLSPRDDAYGTADLVSVPLSPFANLWSRQFTETITVTLPEKCSSKSCKFCE